VVIYIPVQVNRGKWRVVSWLSVEIAELIKCAAPGPPTGKTIGIFTKI